MSGEKTEQPSEKKLRDARQKGQVAKSADFTGVAVMTAALAALALSGATGASELMRFTEHTARFGALEGVALSPAGQLLLGLSVAARVLLPLLVTVFVVAALIAYLQVGPAFTTKPLVPDASRLNIANGLKQMWSVDRLVDLVKNVARLSIMFIIAGVTYDVTLGAMLQTSRGSLWTSLQVLGSAAVQQVQFLLLALAAFGIADLVWQRHSHTKKLMMSKQDVKEEYKQSEGDPHVRAARKRMHQELAQGAGLRRVRDADAVVVNPTHVAAAIRYREDEAEAPRIVAAGRGDAARAIRREAVRRGIPIVRNVELARALADVELEAQIPDDLYEAVAEVLQFVYGLRHPGGH